MLKNRRGFSQAANNKLDGRVCMKEAAYVINVEFFTASRFFERLQGDGTSGLSYPQDLMFTYKNASFTSSEYRRESVRDLLRFVI